MLIRIIAISCLVSFASTSAFAAKYQLFLVVSGAVVKVANFNDQEKCDSAAKNTFVYLPKFQEQKGPLVTSVCIAIE